MQNIVFNMAQMHRHGSAFYDFLRLRKSYFVDRLHWDIPHDDDVEMDQYDNPQAWYSLVRTDDGVIVGGARALATTARWGEHGYMLGDAAKGKLEGIPASVLDGVATEPRVWESTRIVVSDELTTQAERSLCLSLIMEGVVEVAARHGATEIVGLSLPPLVRALRSLGFPAERRGAPWVCTDDGRTYAVLAMPVRPVAPRRPTRVPAGVPASLPPTALPAATHRSQPAVVHAPSVA
jgi:acyl homoserine lactone synthase